MNKCYLCGSKQVKPLIDLGPQPVAHRFLYQPDDEEYLGPLTLGQCQQCSLVQQLKPMPVKELCPRYEWLTSLEPERHLDDLVARLLMLPGMTKESSVLGLSWKEDTTLARMNRLGYENTWRLDLKDDLDIDEEFYPNVETVQERLTVEQAKKIVERRGPADMVIARHLIEHAFDVQEFLKALKTLLHPDGYLVLEIPDCALSMDHIDYTTIWEEHTIYLTPTTFKSCFSYGGFKLIDFIEEEYSLENSYIGIARIAKDEVSVALDEETLAKELARGDHFGQQLQAKRQALREHLTAVRRDQGKVAIFGAAHMSCAFVNFMQLHDCIDFVVDDNQHKKGMFMPGSHLPIYGSDALLSENVKLCLLTLSVASEEIVLEKNQDFVKQGGVFKSIFPRNERALVVNV